MKVLDSYELDEAIHFLQLRERKRTSAVDKVRVSPEIPTECGFVICRDFYVWIVRNSSTATQPSQMEELVIRQTKSKPLFIGDATGMNGSRSRIVFPQQDSESERWLKALLYRAFGHDEPALQPPALAMRNLNPRIQIGSQLTGTLRQVTTRVSNGELNERLF